MVADCNIYLKIYMCYIKPLSGLSIGNLKLAMGWSTVCTCGISWLYSLAL